MRQCIALDAGIFEQQAQGVDDDGRVTVPMEKIIGLRIIGAEHRRSDDGTSARFHGLRETGPVLDDADRRNTAHHGGSAVAVLPLYPAIECFHQPGACPVKLNARSPACISGAFMNSFHNRPVR